jgi:penicillin-binding protein 2
MDIWSNHVKSFGLGNYLNNDLSVGQPGKIPNSKTYDQLYGKNRWGSTFNLSNAIGQGEVLTTPIQLANMAAAISNRGYYYTPHIIKNIEGHTIDPKYLTPNHTTINKEHFEPIIQGMFDVYNRGTAASLQVKGIEICGKTGTAQNFLKVNGKRLELTDHSIFIAFAPKDNPKIAVAVFVENGYWGARFAGKIASLMIEKYLTGTITRTDMEDWLLWHTLEHEYEKPYSGKPFGINKNTTLELVEESEYKHLKELLKEINDNPNSSLEFKMNQGAKL